MANNELSHVGVLGMKWGHRKASSTTRDSARAVASYKLSRKERRYQKDVATAKLRKAQTKAFIKQMMITNRDQPKERQRKEKEFWENFLKDDLNATPESISKERRKTGMTLAAAGLLIVGAAGLQAVVNNYTK